MNPQPPNTFNPVASHTEAEPHPAWPPICSTALEGEKKDRVIQQAWLQLPSSPRPLLAGTTTRSPRFAPPKPIFLPSTLFKATS